MKHFEALRAKLAELADLKGALALLSWDQEVMMPPAGIASRARQSATLSGMQHDIFVQQVGPLLKLVEYEELGQMDEWHRGNIAALRREFDRVEKLPTAHVMEVTQVASQSQQVWAAARAANRFEDFKPWLEKLVELRRKEAEYYGYATVPYDALLDGYEPGMTTQEVKRIFEEVKPGLSKLIARIKEAAPVDERAFACQIPADLQLKFGMEVAQRLGYTTDHGRQDISSHPFSIAISPEDVRITTKVTVGDLREMLYSTIHEAGHALYELGLSMDHYGLPAAEACSMAMHESQSRLWENNVARSLAFWQHFQPLAAQHFPGYFASVTPLEIAKAVNVVKPSLVRISADELTYHFHIIVRFELESALINGEMEVVQLPEAWKQRMEQYLGITPTSDAVGCLQDIHWSFGSFGYFPTYSLGSFYSAQFMAAAEKEIPNLSSEIVKGNFLPLLQWLRRNVHQHGRTLLASEICERATGEKLNVSHFLSYANAKFGELYGLKD
jgi:carboxypeptidase Taq